MRKLAKQVFGLGVTIGLVKLVLVLIGVADAIQTFNDRGTVSGVAAFTYGMLMVKDFFLAGGEA